jgi:hypothetical protein
MASGAPKPKTFLWLLLASSVVTGILAVIEFSPRTTKAVDFISLVMSVSLIFFWYCADAYALKYPRSKALNVFMVALTALALPYYLFRSRGLKGGFFALARSIAFLVAMWATSVAAAIATGFALGA